MGYFPKNLWWCSSKPYCFWNICLHLSMQKGYLRVTVGLWSWTDLSLKKIVYVYQNPLRSPARHHCVAIQATFLNGFLLLSWPCWSTDVSYFWLSADSSSPILLFLSPAMSSRMSFEKTIRSKVILSLIHLCIGLFVGLSGMKALCSFGDWKI